MCWVLTTLGMVLHPYSQALVHEDTQSILRTSINCHSHRCRKALLPLTTNHHNNRGVNEFIKRNSLAECLVHSKCSEILIFCLIAANKKINRKIYSIGNKNNVMPLSILILNINFSYVSIFCWSNILNILYYPYLILNSSLMSFLTFLPDSNKLYICIWNTDSNATFSYLD